MGNRVPPLPSAAHFDDVEPHWLSRRGTVRLLDRSNSHRQVSLYSRGPDVRVRRHSVGSPSHSPSARDTALIRIAEAESRSPSRRSRDARKTWSGGNISQAALQSADDIVRAPFIDLPVGSKVTEIDPDRVVRSWCSWCYKFTHHGRVRRNLMRRDVYKCQSCVHRTLICRWCNCMARGHGTWDDVLCAKCDGTIPEWGNLTPATVRMLGWCSWCLDLTSHDLRMTNFLRRNTFMCEACGGRTALCLICRRAFTRCGMLYDDKICLRCSGTIETWKDVDKNRRLNREKGREVLDHFDPYVSVFPLRRKQYVRALIDGAEFYEALADAIDAATESIFLSFWHFNHWIHLRRRPNEPLRDEDRIDAMLTRKAEQGVQICIILWRENVTAAINNFSKEMKKHMMSLHPNIVVVRHGHQQPLVVHYGHHQKFCVIDQDIGFVGGLDVCLGRYDDSNHRLLDVDTEVWEGLDYYNPHIVRPNSCKNPREDIINRRLIPRMPWHDIDVEVRGDSARDLARNFIQRWNHHVNDFYSNCDYPELTAKTQPAEMSKHYRLGTCLVQVNRSMDTWSGSDRLDRSIYGAYMEAVAGAQNYIYIENQYLSSNVAGGGVENVVATRILDRIREKIRARDVFRVIIVLPQPEETGGSAMEILRWQYQTINRGGSSMLEQLRDEFPTTCLDDYIGFFFLRQHAMLDGRPMTEKVFCHSKLMIVDDRVALISSANFNDRSFLGDRDSELGVYVEDSNSIATKMDGKTFMAGELVYRLRVRLWQEHLGLHDDELHKIVDPVIDSTYRGIWLATAQRNTEIYERVFPSIPRNVHTTMKLFKQAGGMDMPAIAVTDGSELKEIRGLLTLHPIGFLLDEDISTVISFFLGESLLQ